MKEKNQGVNHSIVRNLILHINALHALGLKRLLIKDSNNNSRLKFKEVEKIYLSALKLLKKIIWPTLLQKVA